MLNELCHMRSPKQTVYIIIAENCDLLLFDGGQYSHLWVICTVQDNLFDKFSFLCISKIWNYDPFLPQSNHFITWANVSKLSFCQRVTPFDQYMIYYDVRSTCYLNLKILHYKWDMKGFFAILKYSLNHVQFGK